MQYHIYRSALILLIVSLTSLQAFSQPNQPMYRFAKIRVAANQLDQYHAALNTQMEMAIASEPGVLYYTAVADKNDPTSITILEVYASTSAYQSHILTPHFKKYKETVKDMVLSLELIDLDLVAHAMKNDFRFN